MRRILSHLYCVFFLLFLGGIAVLGAPDVSENTISTKASIEVKQLILEQGTLAYNSSPEYKSKASFTLVEADNGDFNLQDLQDSIVVLVKAVKLGGIVLFFYFVLFAIKRRRTSYDVSIQLFDYKYIVYRVLRI